MSLRGIIFDKDGTLMDYYSVWAPVFKNSILTVLEQVGRPHDKQLEARLLNLLGIGETGVYSDGLVFKASSTSMLLALYWFAVKNRISFIKLYRSFSEGFHGSRYLLKEYMEISEPPCDLHLLFSKLKHAGYTIGLVTNDTQDGTNLTLDILGIKEYFDFISTYGDHLKNKPSTESFREFCRTHDLKPYEVAVVGDAPVDMKYGKRAGAGYLVGVLTGSGDSHRLSKLADVVYGSIGSLLEDTVVFY